MISKNLHDLLISSNVLFQFSSSFDSSEDANKDNPLDDVKGTAQSG
jgi:hypothetical protein